MPIRKIPPNSGSFTGRVAHYGNTGSVGYESFLEHDFLFSIQFDPQVAQMEEQPVRISYDGADATGSRRRKRHYIPDYLVTYHGPANRPPMLVEVKYRAHLDKKRDELLPKIRAGQSYARQRGWRYRVFSEQHIRTSILPSVKFLLPYRRFGRDETRCRRLLDALTPLGRAQAIQLLDACSEQGSEERGKYVACLWWLLASRELAADLATPLSMSTVLWRECFRH